MAFVPLAHPAAWQALPGAVRGWAIGLAAASYAALALHDVPLYKVVGSTTPAAALLASLPNLALLALAFVLALLLAGHDAAARGRAGGGGSISDLSHPEDGNRAERRL